MPRLCKFSEFSFPFFNLIIIFLGWWKVFLLLLNDRRVGVRIVISWRDISLYLWLLSDIGELSLGLLHLTYVFIVVFVIFLHPLLLFSVRLVLRLNLLMPNLLGVNLLVDYLYLFLENNWTLWSYGLSLSLWLFTNRSDIMLVGEAESEALRLGLFFKLSHSWSLLFLLLPTS
jgi:hypothetical protein